jgi:Cu+-exporting ATPase
MSDILAQADLTVLGMTCSRCAATVERVLTKKLAGISAARVSLASERVQIDYDPQKASLADMAALLDKSGYTLLLPRAGDDQAAQWQAEGQARQEEYLRQKKTFYLGLSLALPLLVLSMARDMGAGFLQSLWIPWLLWLLATPVQFITGFDYYRNGWRSIINLQPGMDLLIAMGSSVAYFHSLWVLLSAGEGHVYFETSALIITFIKAGKLLESKARGRASSAISRLMSLSPPLALVYDSQGQECEIPSSQVEVGRIFIVKPGASVPTDGEIVEGHSSLNEAMLSGESMPVPKQPGDMVYGATLNSDGLLKVRACRVGEDTALARIIAQVRQAQNSKAPVERLADRVAGYFVPAIIIIAGITFLLWWLALGQLQEGWLRLVAVLVAACPCALGLATPAAVTVGMGLGAGQGIFFRSSQVLEQTSQIDQVIIDKTGTLTQGRPRLTDYPPELLLLAASLEAGSEHPLALALTRAAREQQLKLLPVEDFTAVPGRGVTGLCQGQRVSIGSPDWLGPLPPFLESQALALYQQGKSVAIIAVEGQAAGLLGLADEPRPEAKDTVAALERMGLPAAMLTGDNERAAAFIARQVGLEQIYAGALPQDKERIVASLPRAAFVGDGINDAPALARAFVGIALGSGADAAKAAGGITLTSPDLRGVVKAIALGRAIMRTIKQNLFWAFFYNLALVPVAAGVLYGFHDLPEPLRHLHPAGAALAMALSSLTVLGNSLRLKGFFGSS